MSMITGDPLFIRAELDYRREVWAGAPVVPSPPTLDALTSLRRRIASGRRARVARVHRGVALPRPGRY